MLVSTDPEHFDWLLVKSPCNANFGVGVEKFLITTQPISVINQCAISKLSPQQGWGTRSWVLGLLPWLWHPGVVFGEAEQKSHGHQGHQVGPGSSKRSSSAELPGSLQQSYRHKEMSGHSIPCTTVNVRHDFGFLWFASDLQLSSEENMKPSTMKRFLRTMEDAELIVGSWTISSFPLTTPTRSSFSKTAARFFCHKERQWKRYLVLDILECSTVLEA